MFPVETDLRGSSVTINQHPFSALRSAPVSTTEQSTGVVFSGAEMQNLYLIKCRQYYKIGVANDIESRLAQLSTGNPFPLEVELYYVFENAEVVERAVHQKFKAKRERGEWFSLSAEDKNELHKICLMLGGSAFEYVKIPDDDAVEDADDELAESLVDFDPLSPSYRIEKRYSPDGSLRGIAWRERNDSRQVVKYIGKRHPEFSRIVDDIEAVLPEHIRATNEYIRNHGLKALAKETE